MKKSKFFSLNSNSLQSTFESSCSFPRRETKDVRLSSSDKNMANKLLNRIK